jgi:hypothetical protein
MAGNFSAPKAHSLLRDGGPAGGPGVAKARPLAARLWSWCAASLKQAPTGGGRIGSGLPMEACVRLLLLGPRQLQLSCACWRSVSSASLIAHASRSMSWAAP